MVCGSPLSFFHFSVNDIVVLGPEEFYATRDHYFAQLLLDAIRVVHGSSLDSRCFSTAQERLKWWPEDLVLPMELHSH